MPASLPPHLQLDGDTESAQSGRIPLWETLVMVASFALLWVWFIERHKANVAQQPMATQWNIALVAALAVLVWVFLRRMTRVLKALRSQNLTSGSRRSDLN